MRLGSEFLHLILSTVSICALNSLFAQENMCIIQKRIRCPEQALENGIEGTVQVEVVRDKNCLFTGKRILEGLGYGLDEEALKLINDKTELCLMRGRRYCSDTLVIPISFIIPQ